VLPPDFSLDWSGASFQEKRQGGTSILVLLLGALMAFLILAAQYEKWSLPLSVMLALPFGTFGALAAIWINNFLGSLYYVVGGMAPSMQWLVAPLQGLARLSNDVYFQIGLVTLLGLAAKNAILIVEYAVMKHHEGLSASAAAVEAARLRFRPILMTSMAFILGVLPLVLSDGAGAGARNSAGTGVMGGMLAATFLAIFFVPTFFKLLTDRHLTEKRSSQQIKDEAAHARNVTHTPVHHPHVAPRGGDE
jgi:multidrug efflux pump subunit AcrB